LPPQLLISLIFRFIDWRKGYLNRSLAAWPRQAQVEIALPSSRSLFAQATAGN
jgi:hypothetical protein